MLVDVHCHLNFKEFNSDRDEVIKRAKKNGFVSIIVSGTEHNTNKDVLKLAEKYDIIKASLGLYPTYIEKLSKKEFQRDLEFIKKNKDKIIAIGELGADFKEIANESKKKLQLERLRTTLTELKKLKKPFIIHSRKAEKECVELLEELKIKKALFHCFTGNYKLAKRIEQNNWYLSIPTILARNQHFQGIVNNVSINSILTETDAPYLAPNPQERNEPLFIKSTIKKIAEIKKIDEEEVKKNIFLNYQKLFS